MHLSMFFFSFRSVCCVYGGGGGERGGGQAISMENS